MKVEEYINIIKYKATEKLNNCDVFCEIGEFSLRVIFNKKKHNKLIGDEKEHVLYLVSKEFVDFKNQSIFINTEGVNYNKSQVNIVGKSLSEVEVIIRDFITRCVPDFTDEWKFLLRSNNTQKTKIKNLMLKTKHSINTEILALIDEGLKHYQVK